jgi:hypothetical protein
MRRFTQKLFFILSISFLLFFNGHIFAQNNVGISDNPIVPHPSSFWNLDLIIKDFLFQG